MHSTGTRLTQDRPHTSTGGYLVGHQTESQISTANNRTFISSGANPGYQQLQPTIAPNGASQKKGKTGGPNSRPSTGHNIKGRNLNSNTQAKHVNRTATAGEIDGSNASQILAVNLLPTSQPEFGTGHTSVSTYSRSNTHEKQGHASTKHVTQSRQSIGPRPKSSAQMKSATHSKTSLQPTRQSNPNVNTSSGLGTAKSGGSRVAQSTLN